MTDSICRLGDANLLESEGFGLLLETMKSGYASYVGCEVCVVKRQSHVLIRLLECFDSLKRRGKEGANSRAIVGIIPYDLQF